VETQLGCAQVRREDRFEVDLGAESFDMLNLVVAVEDRYGIVIDEERAQGLDTVDDLFTEIAARQAAR
jgi:acyl carrier protein